MQASDFHTRDKGEGGGEREVHKLIIHLQMCWVLHRIFAGAQRLTCTNVLRNQKQLSSLLVPLLVSFSTLLRPSMTYSAASVLSFREKEFLLTD